MTTAAGQGPFIAPYRGPLPAGRNLTLTYGRLYILTASCGEEKSRARLMKGAALDKPDYPEKPVDLRPIS